MLRLALLPLLVVLLATFVACGDETSEQPCPNCAPASGGAAPTAQASGGAMAAPPCEPGTINDCACDNGAPGRQLCDAAGRPEACVCRFPPGQLSCLGKLCRAGGVCGPGGQCPAAFHGCFTEADGYDTCAVYCQSVGQDCVARGCDPAGYATTDGFTSISYSVDQGAACQAGDPAPSASADECVTPIWLQPSKPRDDWVRCCCTDR